MDRSNLGRNRQNDDGSDQEIIKIDIISATLG
jgi:hypothetical protein